MLFLFNYSSKKTEKKLSQAYRDRGTGRKASRAATVPGPTAEQGTQAAMADQETLWAMADSPPTHIFLGCDRSLKALRWR